MSIRFERVWVTPGLARKYLAKNIEGNRGIAKTRVQQYGRDMASGNWLENGDSIKFSDTGEMVDGQKRLTACIEFNVPFWTLVATGIKREAFLTIDRNQPRSIGQQLHLAHGVTDHSNLQAALTWLTGFMNGIVTSVRLKPTAREVEEAFEDNPGMQESVKRAGVVHAALRTPSKSALGFCHYCFTRQDATLAESFFEALATGANLKQNDPVYRLRERLISSAAAANKRLPTFDFIAIMFKAWQMEKEGRKLENTLRWQVGESFPNIGPIGTRKRKPEAVVETPVNVPKKRKGFGGKALGAGNANTKANRAAKEARRQKIAGTFSE